jgi:Na+/melibiose symporter-like transporter
VTIQFLQAGLGYSALRSASGMLPMVVAMMPLSIIAPSIAQRVGFRRTVVTGMLLLAAGVAALGLMADVGRGYTSVLPGLIVLAVGAGLAMSPSTTAITASLPEEKQGVASALNDTAREMGASIGISLVGSVLNAGYRAHIAATVDRMPPVLARPVRQGIGGGLAVAARLGPRGRPLALAARDAFVAGMRPAMLLLAGVALAAAAFTAWSPGRVSPEIGPRPDPIS